MQQQLKKLYFMATRNNSFIPQRNINKYLPLKNDIVNYDTIFEINKNLKQVKLSFQNSRQKQKRLIKGQNKDISLYKKRQKRNKYHSPYNEYKQKQQLSKNMHQNRSNKSIQLLKIQDTRQRRQQIVKTKQKHRSRKHYNITIIENKSSDEEEEKTKAKSIEKNKTQIHRKINKHELISNKSKQKLKKTTQQASQQIKLHQSQLDSYIDQYLIQLVKQNKSNIKQQIQIDRKLFIEKAIKNIKNKIKQKTFSPSQSIQTINKTQQQLQFKLRNNHSDQIIQQNHQYQKQSNKHYKQMINHQKIVNNNRKIPKQKRKCNSTQLIPPSSNIQSNQQRFLPSLKSHGSSQKVSVPHRSIYASSPGAQFIKKIGKTFYLNELNILNKTLQLEARNRQRAQRFFRRKLMNIEKQYDKIFENRNIHQNPQYE